MATNSLGRLTLDMVVKLGNYMEGLDKAGRQAKKSGKEIESGMNIGSMAIKALGAAAAGITIGGIAAFATQTIEAGNEIKKFSQLANTSMRDFQYYSKGAVTAGISIESFADKMKDMQDRIGDFQQSGGGPLVDFFENIAPLVGVTIQQFQKLSGPEALQLYYDSLVKVGATQNDIKFYMEAIISDSSLLLPLLENNGAGFKKWGDEAERTGAILSDDMVNSLAKAKEHLYSMDLQWQGLQATLVNNTVPVLQVVIDNFDNIEAVAVAVAAGMAAKFIPSLIASTVQLGQLVIFSARAGAGLLSLSGSAGVATGTMVALRGAVAFLGGPAGIAMLAIQGVAAASAFAYMKKSSSDAETALTKQGKSVAELVIEYNNLSEAQKRAFKYQETVELKDLSESYEQARQQVRAYASSIAEVVAKDESTKNTIRGWIKDFDNQKISAEDLANKINKLSDVGSENKQHMDKHAVAATSAKNSMVAQQKVVESLSTQTMNLTKKSDALTVSTNNQAQAWIALTQKQRAALTGIQNQNARSQYIANNMALGWSREKAEYVADYRDEAGLDYAKRLTKYELIQLENGFKIQQQAKAKEESEKKIEDAKKKQLELSEKQYSYSNSELKMLQKVSELNSKHNLNSIGAKYGIPNNMLAAVMAQESKGNISAKSPTGAIGPFQTTSIYRKQHGLTVADSYDVKKSAEAAAKDLAASFEIFGNWNDAITAYNAGVQGTKNLRNKGYTGSAAKTKEAKEYSGLVDKWLVGLGGSSNKSSGVLANDAAANLKDWSEYWGDLEEVRKQALENQQTVQQTYFTEEQQLTFEHEEKIKAIELAYAGDDAAIKKYTELQNSAYKKDLEEYQETQKFKTLADKRQLLEAKRFWISATEYAKEYYALIREEILNTAEYSPEMKQSLVKEANFNQGLESNAEREQVWGDYKSMMGLDKSPYQQDMDLLAEARAHMLITEEEYQQQRLAMQMSYGAQYGADFAGMMMGLVDSSSAAYAILGGVQKGFALFSTALNSYQAISAAWASAPPPYNLPAVAMATMETGLLQAAVSALSPVGMAHNGIDNIPKEGTWLLDGGERVLNPQQNKDLTNYLSQAQNSSGQSQVNLNPNFVIVDERESLSDYLFSPDGTKAFVKFFKRNRSALGV